MTFGFILKLEHKIGNFICIQLKALFFLTYIPVLTKYTSEITHSEENSSRSIPPLKNGFFSKMWECWAYNSFTTSVACTCLTLQKPEITTSVPFTSENQGSLGTPVSQSGGSFSKLGGPQALHLPWPRAKWFFRASQGRKKDESGASFSYFFASNTRGGALMGTLGRWRAS